MKPILFNTEMVRAILDGRKTVTRRIVKGDLEGLYAGRCALGVGMFSKETSKRVIEPPFKVNDILYVRETWREHIRPLGSPKSYGYRAATDDRVAFLFDWKPSIHMPKEAARIFLKVTGVRVERLQEITRSGMIQEGIKDHCGDCKAAFGCDLCMAEGAVENEFMVLWNITIKKDQLQYYGWNANPYVWVIEFEVIDKAAALKEGQA